MCGPDVEPPATNYKTQAPFQPTPAATAKRGDLVVERFPITYDGYTYRHGHIAYVKGRPPAPVVLVHHNYAGLKQFDIDQAAFIAKVGYVGLAVDLYKDTEEYSFADRVTGADNAFPVMNGLYLKPKPWRGLMRAYLDAAFEHPSVAAGLAGAIGYCLGGQSCLEQVRGGHPLQVIVTLHGLLQSRPFRDFPTDREKMTQEEYVEHVDVPPTTMTPGCQVVVLNGALDGEVPMTSMEEWFVEVTEHKVDWIFNTYGDTPHGFALPPGCPGCAYHEASDRRSTHDMLQYFAETWPDFKQYPLEMNAAGTRLRTFRAPLGGGPKGKGKGKDKGKGGGPGDGSAAEKGKGKTKGRGPAGGKGKQMWRVKASSGTAEA